MARAAVIVACGDSEAALEAVAAAITGKSSAPMIAVRTKSDASPPARNELVTIAAKIAAERVVAASAETGEGLDALLEAIVSLAAADVDLADADAPLLTQERHRFAVGRALEEVRQFRERWRAEDVPAPVAAVHLREAVTTLEDLIGAVGVEDVLDEVFRRFCVGK